MATVCLQPSTGTYWKYLTHYSVTCWRYRQTPTTKIPLQLDAGRFCRVRRWYSGVRCGPVWVRCGPVRLIVTPDLWMHCLILWSGAATVNMVVEANVTRYYAADITAITLLCRWDGEFSDKTDSLTGWRGVRWPPVIALISAVITCLVDSSIHLITVRLKKTFLYSV